MTPISKGYKRLGEKTERTLNQKIVEWMNEIVREKNLGLGEVEQETVGPDRKQPDIVIRHRPRSERILCVIELKPPAFDPYDEEELLAPAREKATRRQAPYFATSNFQELIWFDTKKANNLEPIERQLVERYTLSTMVEPRTIDDPVIRGSIRRGLEKFLGDLVEVSTGKKAKPKHAIDELLVHRLQHFIRVLAVYYKEIIRERVASDRVFALQLEKWFADQGWDFFRQDDDYEKAARQAAYLLVNKLLFYSVVQPIRRLDPLEIPASLTSGARLQTELQGFFDLVLEIDYETIYSADFIDQVAFPNNANVVEEIKELVGVLAAYDFSKVGYEVIGRIFETLIPDEERHTLGQYFTNPDVVDVILRFCHRSETDKVLDPSCGAGTFLVRAYQHKKLMNHRLEHEDILKTLWGNDIAKFPAHLATINLAVGDLRSDDNYPRITQCDFFDLLPDKVSFLKPPPVTSRKVKLESLGANAKTVEHPRYFDCIVGNPPYTRHGEIEDIQGKKDNYKESIIQKALSSTDGSNCARLSRRAGIFAYFFVHSAKFLQNGCRLGFVVANSWLDADYGGGLQQHFLANYKIVAIVESKVERWFADADVNTCIVVLEKAAGNERRRERAENLVRFVYLFKPLRHFIPAAESMWEKQLSRLRSVDNLIKTVLQQDDYYENEDLRVYPVKQKDLEVEGTVRREYVGSKWGKYLRAPRVFFTIMDKVRKKLIPLRSLAEINEGKPTGAEDFFFLKKETAKRYGIERRFLKPGILKPRGKALFELKGTDVDRYFLATDASPDKLSGTGVMGYIRHGERRKLNRRRTFANKMHWYSFTARNPADIFLSRGVGDRYYATLNSAGAICSGSFTEIRLHNKKHTRVVWAFLNSQLGWLLLEIHGRGGLGGGLLKIDPTDIRKMLVIDPEACLRLPPPRPASMLCRAVGTVYEEAVAEDRRQLDDYIMNDILRLTKAEQQEVKEAILRLVTDRLERAKSLPKNNKKHNGLDVERFVQAVLPALDDSTIGPILRREVLRNPCRVRTIPNLTGRIAVEKTFFDWHVRANKTTIICSTEAEARYIAIMAQMGYTEVPVPNDPAHLASIVGDLEMAFERTSAILAELTSSILRLRTRQRVTHTFWAYVRQQAEAPP